MSELTHFNDQGRAKMVDVSGKDQTLRIAAARGTVLLNEETFRLVEEGRMKKGDVLSVAQVAGIMAAKKNSELIPMCHPIALTGVDIAFELDREKKTIGITATVRCKGETGVEMEALTAVSVAALTVYDMCKAVQKDIVIDGIRLVSKSGGKSGDYQWNGENG
jgi:cyclic pyranopterin phosphate synthase